MNNTTYFDGVFNTLREQSKNQQPFEPEFVLQAFVATYGTEALAILPEFQVTEFAYESIQAWEINFSNRENNTQIVWLLEDGGEFVTTTCNLRLILNLEEVEVFPWSNLLWSEVAEALPPLKDRLWTDSNEESVELVKGFTSLYYQSA